MQRLLMILALVGLPLVASAQALEQRISDELAAQGFAVTEMYRTWLGRLRVIAESDSYYRELVFDPSTGELLADYVEELARRAERQALATAREDRRDRDRDRWQDVVAEPETGVMVDVPELAATAEDGAYGIAGGVGLE